MEINKHRQRAVCRRPIELDGHLTERAGDCPRLVDRHLGAPFIPDRTGRLGARAHLFNALTCAAEFGDDLGVPLEGVGLLRMDAVGRLDHIVVRHAAPLFKNPADQISAGP